MNADHSPEPKAPVPPHRDVLSVYASVLTTLQMDRGLESDLPGNRSYLDDSRQKVGEIVEQAGLTEHDARLFLLGFHIGSLSMARAMRLPED